MSKEHFHLILGALEIGLPDDHPDLQYEMPTILEGLQPPTAVRAIVSIDGQSYEVKVSPAREDYGVSPQPPECPKSTHGKHTPVDGKCIGCGETVS